MVRDLSDDEIEKKGALVRIDKIMSPCSSYRARATAYAAEQEANAYAAAPVSIPTRAPLLTGKRVARLGMTIWREGAINQPRNRRLLSTGRRGGTTAHGDDHRHDASVSRLSDGAGR